MRMFLRLLAGGFMVIALAPPVALADNASDIQALKEQVRAMQKKLDELGAQQTAGTVAAPAPTNQGTAANDERKRREVPSLTFAGVTLYGTVDLGIAYLSHGAPLSSSWGPGLPYFIQNYSYHSILSVAGNG